MEHRVLELAVKIWLVSANLKIVRIIVDKKSLSIVTLASPRVTLVAPNNAGPHDTGLNIAVSDVQPPEKKRYPLPFQG